MHTASNPMGEVELDLLEERFFTQRDAAVEPAHAELTLDDWGCEPMPAIQRVAMLVTVAPLMAMVTVAFTLVFSP